MKKTLITLLGALALMIPAVGAEAVTLTTASTTFLGRVDPGSPASSTAEVFYINYLLDMTLNDSDLGIDTGLGSDPHDFFRSGNACPNPATCPDATTVGANSNVDNGGAAVIDLNVSTWTYIVAKYGNESYVWYIADEVLITLNQIGPNGNGLSHYSLYNPGGTFVPDGGTTLSLLGLGMLGLGYLRSRRK